MSHDPEDPFDDIFRELERVMTDVMGLAPNDAQSDAPSDPHVDIYEYDDEIKVIADLPGATKDAIDLQCDGHTLSITLTTTDHPRAQRVRLPVPVDKHTGAARYNNGILEVTFTTDPSTPIDIT